jgi:hypothetical protein
VGCMDTFTDDGEGYTLSVICADDATMEKARLPYYDEMATDTRPHVLNPWQVLPPNTEIPGEK